MIINGVGNGAPKVASSLYPESSSDYGVVSTLIYGAQWDTALKFIGAYNVGEEGYDRYATNSTGMGNYSGMGNGDTFPYSPTTAGGAVEFRQKNIYDMAGNVWELTNEKRGTRPIWRGGSADGGDPASYRASNQIGYADSYLGFRVALYIRSN